MRCGDTSSDWEWRGGLICDGGGVVPGLARGEGRQFCPRPAHSLPAQAIKQGHIGRLTRS
jgi:hypothetical protein